MIENNEIKKPVEPHEAEIMIMVNGEMVRIPPGPPGYVLVSRGPNLPPEWIPKDEI